MPEEIHSLLTLFKGWDGYQISLVRAIAPLSREQLAYRPVPHLRSAGELAVTLGMQNIAIPELGDEGGHIIEPPLAEPL